MNEYPNDEGYPPSNDGRRTQPGAPFQGAHVQPGVPPQPWPSPAPSPLPVARDVLPDPDGMYKDGFGYGLWALWLLGLAGIHRIYMGKYGTGIL